nr:protein gamma response 1 [Ipomoea batatas]
MEENAQKSPQIAYPAEIADAKYIARLSTILVATIEEAKDRISQIEYIFCSQLFPNFQSNSKCLQQIFMEAKNAAEAAWKEKENDLLLQMEKIQVAKQQILEENLSLKLENAKLLDGEFLWKKQIKELQEDIEHRTCELNELREVHEQLSKLLESKASLLRKYEDTQKELEHKNVLLLKTQQNLELEVQRLQMEVKNKSREIDGDLELQRKLVQMAQEKTSSVAYKERQLKKYEEKAEKLHSELREAQRKVEKLQEELGEKSTAIEKAIEVQESLLNKVQSKDLELMNNEQLLSKFQSEKELLMAKMKNLEVHVDELQIELRKKNVDVEDGRKLHEGLLQQIDLYCLERSKTGQELEELEKEKKQLLAKLKDFREKAEELQANLQERSTESSQGLVLDGKLLEQIEAKDSELLSAKKKIKDISNAYKSLKSQYNFLRARAGLTSDNVKTKIKLEDESKLRHNQSPLTKDGVETDVPRATIISCEEPKQENALEETGNNEVVKLVQRSNSVSPLIANTSIALKEPQYVKSCLLAGRKRSGSYWRDTRSHQSRVGPDPHDDFLDTPLENVRRNTGNVIKEDISNLPKAVPKDMDCENSDDETQDMNINQDPQKQQIPSSRPSTSGFKYIEPVRKKSERENLKGIECKQCKKFYDAVLPSEGKDFGATAQNLRCEHHDGVSRHRYRYAPPSTPEGFWNIGFESEM